MATKKRKTRGGSSSRSVPQVNSNLGLQTLSYGAKRMWDKLTRKYKQIEETKFSSVSTLSDLGLLLVVEHLMSKVGIHDFLHKQSPTYKRYTLEFLSTLERGEDEDGPYITCHLNDDDIRMNKIEVSEAFGRDYGDDGSFENFEGYNEAVFGNAITTWSHFAWMVQK